MLERGLSSFGKAVTKIIGISCPWVRNSSSNWSPAPDLITELAVRHKLPAMYPFRYYIRSGGLICYGSDLVNQSRPAADYIDCILKGEKPADLPV